MAILALGLVIFLGTHSIRMLAGGWRERQIARLGEKGWKGLYSLASAIGLGLVIVGFGAAGEQAPLWRPPAFMPHVTALLSLIAFLLLAAAFVPANRLKARVGHPLVLAVKSWAFAHLLSNGQPRHLLLFGAFLAWSAAEYAVRRRRDRHAGVVPAPGGPAGDLVTLAAGLVGWAAFAFYLHGLLIGVKPLG